MSKPLFYKEIRTSSGIFKFTISWKNIWVAGVMVAIWWFSSFWIALLAFASHVELEMRD